MKDQGLVVVGANTGGLGGGDTTSIVQQFVAQTGVTFPIGWDSGATYSRFRTGAGVSPFPLDVVVGRDGRVAYLSREYDAAAMRTVVERELAK